MNLAKRQILLTAAAMLASAHPKEADACDQFVISRGYSPDLLPVAPKLDMGRSKHGFQKSCRPGKKVRR